MYQSFHRLLRKIIIKLHARFCNSHIQIFSYRSILTFRMPGLWNSQLCLSHIFKCISHILAFTQMYLLIFVFLTIRKSQFYKIPVLSFLVLSLLVGCSQFCLSQFYVVTTAEHCRYMKCSGPMSHIENKSQFRKTHSSQTSHL